MSKPVKRPPLVEVEWVDSMGYSGWSPRDARIVDMEKVEDLDHITSGYLLKRSSKYIAVAQSVGRLGSVDNCIQIPRCAVRKVTVIRKGEH